MPTQIHDDTPPAAIGSGGADKYEWDKWIIRGRHWVFTEADDFPGVTMNSFRQRVRLHAAERELKAITRKVDDFTVEVWIEERT